MVSALCDLKPEESVSPRDGAGYEDAARYVLEKGLYNCSSVRMLGKHSFCSF